MKLTIKINMLQDWSKSTMTTDGKPAPKSQLVQLPMPQPSSRGYAGRTDYRITQSDRGSPYPRGSQRFEWAVKTMW
ncbi:hypothetical protein AB1N83_009040 [Pleurotus pulmonarius]